MKKKKISALENLTEAPKTEARSLVDLAAEIQNVDRQLKQLEDLTLRREVVDMDLLSYDKEGDGLIEPISLRGFMPVTFAFLVEQLREYREKLRQQFIEASAKEY